MFNNRHIDWSDTYGPGMGKAEDLGWNQHLKLGTRTGTKQIRLNSVTWTNTSGNLIGVSSKPNANGGAGATADLKGMEISPRFAGLTSGGNLIGMSVDPILKGTSGADGDLSGVVRGIEITITDENAGTRTITGKSAAIRIWQQLTAKTFTNGLFPIQIDTKGGAAAWTAALSLANDGELASASDAGENMPAGVTEFIRVQVGSTLYRIPLYHITN